MTVIEEAYKKMLKNLKPHEALAISEYVETQMSVLEDELRNEMDTLEQIINSLAQRLDNI